ncbi:MAG: agmatinase [Pseudodesulfovibrio sp.]|uniref:agmatinase n=1 Tax=Pseudodesulfovibrio sp. TaxID=2035812 RepID=UPI003D0CA8C6
MKKYHPVDSLQSPRFAGVSTFMRLPHVRTLEDVDFVVVGQPFDTATTFRPGCRFGPRGIREASSILKAYNPVLDVDLFEHLSGVDYGDIDIVPGYLEESHTRITEGMSPIFESGVTPVILGGDHSITLPTLRALHRHHGPVSLLHFDAHSDTSSDYFGKPYNHGTPFYWAMEEGLIDPTTSIQVGMRGHYYSKDCHDYALGKGMEIITGWELHEIGIPAAIERIRERIKGTKVFLSFDIDFMDAAYAPGTGTPEIGGFTSYEALRLVTECCLDQNMLGMDLVEVLPDLDHAQITALAAAGVIHAFLSVLAKNKAA